jgi:hypothetical protein
MDHMKMIVAIAILAGVMSSQSSALSASTFLSKAKVSLSLVCPATVSSDPSFSFRLTNLGATAVEVDQQVPISVLLRLTVRDANGKVVEPEFVDSGSRRTMEPRFLQPGRSLMLDEWVIPDRPRTTIIPISLFGYHLAPGEYSVLAKVANSPDALESNVCHVSIR